MKLIELIDCLIEPERLNKFYQEKSLNTESEAFLIYMKDALDLNSDILVFEIEETGDDLHYEKQGIKYIQFFSVEHAIDLIENDLDLKQKGLTTAQIAVRLLDYRLNDA